ncbi:MAG TPA: HD domain-containing phosphohydrolase [Terracidiphilus sp.]|jgi:putative nucleotidyltransferase with HDIG domain|nr:HD domain-containing phosphohydrolase [Terracidiphilus sp.]
MTPRGKAFVCLILAGAAASAFSTFRHPSVQWFHFSVYLVAVLLSSGMKVALPKSEGTMSVNFPLILLGVLQLSPMQATALAVASVLAQCRFGVVKQFTVIQILFNIANVTTATVLSWHTYALSVHWLNGESAPALAIAATVYFFANTVPVALIIGIESHTAPHKQWLDEILWYLPFYLVGALLAATANFIGVKFGWFTSMLLIPMVYTVYRAYQAQVSIVRDRERHIVETEALHLRAIEGLALAIEAKDENTHRHLMRVRVYVSELGKVMELDKPMMQALLTAALLHDIGKLAVPEYIINKPGKLTPEEFDKMKIHPVVGADILERIQFPYPVVPIVRSHHEAWDGSGYPDGLKGEEIPIGARLLTAVDCFDALASDRPYRKALPLDQAMAFVKSKAGIQFDPLVVKLLEEHFPRLEAMACSQIHEMQPLRTDLTVERGAAPAAGFAQEGPAQGGSASIDLPKLLAAVRKEADSLLAWTETPGLAITVDQLGRSMSNRLRSLFPFDCFALYTRREDVIYPRSIHGAGAGAFSDQAVPVGEGLSGWVAMSHRSILNGNPTVEINHRAESDFFTPTSSALSIPLFDANGVLFAVLSLYARTAAAFSREHLRLLEAAQPCFASALLNALENETSAAVSQSSRNAPQGRLNARDETAPTDSSSGEIAPVLQVANPA